jgi:selenocysteine-specific elongation factor
VNIGSRGHTASISDGIQRGNVITLPELGAPCDALDVLIEKSPRLINSSGRAARPLKDGTLVRIHHASANFPARVLLLDSGRLLPGQRLLAQLRCRVPVFAFAGDRFIVRDWPEQSTLAGGIILDADSNRKNFRLQAHRKFLEQRAASPDDVSVFTASQLLRDHAVRRSALLVKSRFGTAEICKAVSRLISEAQAIEAGDWVAEATWWKGLCHKAAEAIRSAHRLHPERIGLPLNDLRKAVESDLPDAEVFNALVSELCRSEFIQTGTAIRHAAHRPALPPHLQSAGAKLRAALSARPLEPPSRKELAPDGSSQQALRFLFETGEAIELGDEVVLLTEHFNRASETIKKFLRERGFATVSELRQALATSRRIMVPLLERLDRDGITLREGDRRVLKRKD